MSKVLMLGSHKGEVGKTTLAVNIAVLLVSQGKKIIILKADKNDELTDWSNHRKTGGNFPIAIRGVQENISGEIEKMGYRKDS